MAMGSPVLRESKVDVSRIGEVALLEASDWYPNEGVMLKILRFPRFETHTAA